MQTLDENWFRQRLEAFLCERHPHRNLSQGTIIQRSRLAAESYGASIGCGVESEQAIYRADKILFRGLLFSPYDVVRLILETDYPAIPENQRHNITLKLLGPCRPIFRIYNLGDDFMQRQEFRQLKAELRIGIRNWIDENGIPGYRSPARETAPQIPYSRRPKYAKSKKRR